MKKMLLMLAMVLGASVAAQAMSYEAAREQALFLTDKMAYELNLNEEQYEYCYEINLDYLLGVETADDVYGVYLRHRNADLRHILFDWQYSLFVATDYFFRPLLWSRGMWVYPIYRHYAYGHFYFDRPHVYISYRGGHGRGFYGGGYYVDRRPHWDGGFRGHDRGAVGRGGDFRRGGNSGHTNHGYDGRTDRGNGGHANGGYSFHGHGDAGRPGGNTHSGGNMGSHNGGNMGSHSGNGGHYGQTRPSTNDARVGSFSRSSGSGAYTHPSSTRSSGSNIRSSSAASHSSFGGGSRGSYGGGSSRGAMSGQRGSSTHGRGR